MDARKPLWGKPLCRMADLTVLSWNCCRGFHCLGCWRMLIGLKVAGREWIIAAHRLGGGIGHKRVDMVSNNSQLVLNRPRHAKQISPTLLPDYQQPEQLVQGRMDPCIYVVHQKFWSCIQMKQQQLRLTVTVLGQWASVLCIIIV